MVDRPVALPDYLQDSPFEAAFLGGLVWRLTDHRHADDAVALARASGVRLMSCRTDTAADLAASGFRRVETLVTLSMPRAAWRPGSRPREGIAVRDAVAADCDACREIARTAFAENRYAVDPAISDRAAGAIKAQWIDNAIAGRADRVVVAELAGRLAGFNAVFLNSEAIVIDLIAVADGARGKGIGRLLIDAVLADYAGEAAMVRVGTQASNKASLAFYAQMGFVAEREQTTWHWGPGDQG